MDGSAVMTTVTPRTSTNCTVHNVTTGRTRWAMPLAVPGVIDGKTGPATFWSMAIHRIGLVLHPVRDTTEQVRAIQRWAATHDGEVVLSEGDRARAVDGVLVLDDETFTTTVDGVISLGG